MRYVWVIRRKLPILYVDPAPFLGPYIYQRLITGLMPRPVRWWPGNWLLLPICWLISGVAHMRAIAAADMKADKDRDDVPY